MIAGSEWTLIDISMPISARVITDPPPLRPRITYRAHRDGAADLAGLFPGLSPADLPDGEGWAVEDLSLTSHSGTHMDAPWHYHSTTDGGARRAPTIDEAPLDLFLRPGVKLDFRHLPDGHVVSAREVEHELRRIGHHLAPFDIVLVNTSAAAAYGSPDYPERGCGLGREATLYLTGHGVQVVGTDAWSWDAPFAHTAKRFARERDPAIIWEGHKAGRERAYYQMEKLQNLDRLPATGFTVMCFPVKIEAASAGWVRAVAQVARA
ncbi:cyclase family protein [Novosphingobium piscinae]|uniref:Cyclase family protein n=1 Tax=Novosphingobium piscinae TaxID=1507448 RepID=A0A7X1FV85_9SPHN|nr:cyclase family protein [Novosphingobium piscinae]MBC2667598.1 cyclase family protein [Novosphingobium piscinae]